MSRPVALPPLLFITDSQRVPDIQSRISRLPNGAGVLLRDYEHPDRGEWAAQIAALCRQHHIPLLVAGDAGLARRVMADGVHLPERMMTRLPGLKRRYPHWRFTVAAHSLPALITARRLGADAALLSPFYATATHPEAKALPVFPRSAWLHRHLLPVYALGGLSLPPPSAIKHMPLAGVAGIGFWPE